MWTRGHKSYSSSSNDTQFGMHQCTGVVEKFELNGSQFLNMTEVELSKFNILHQPHLQKMVRDIKKNEGGFMDKIKKLRTDNVAIIYKTGQRTWDRITNKAPPNVPRRDYASENASAEDDQWSDDFDSDYENPDGQSDSETYVDPSEDCGDDNYEPPPMEAEKKKVSPAFSYSTGEYAGKLGGNGRQQPFSLPLPSLPSNSMGKQSPALPRMPNQPPSKLNPPLSKPNPPLPTPRNVPHSNTQSLDRKPQPRSHENGINMDEDDYIVPVEEDEEDNYIEPTEDAPPPPLKPPPVIRSSKPTLAGSTPTPVVMSTSVLYEVCEQEAKPKPSHPQSRNNMWKSPPQHKMEETVAPAEDEYEICDPDDSDSNGNHIFKPAPTPAPLPRTGMKALNISKQNLPVPLRETVSKEDKPTPVERRKGSSSASEALALQQTSAVNLKQGPPKASILPKPPEPSSRKFCPPARNNVSATCTAAEQEAGVYSKEWYASSCDRRAAEEALQKSNKDGAFLIRKSSGQDLQQPYTLVVLFNRKVYNIPVRYIESTGQYALGREKSGEERFTSVAEMVQNHQRSPLVLIDSQNNTKDSTKLRHAVRVS
ncbi:B-cell linker protein isoform X2 [Pleurodeles waltl]|uniref:B-cell linker protein isoform X2 n=1 Tax=Pleurodeles waltl TaxID=8319 RepID=UPI003709A376